MNALLRSRVAVVLTLCLMSTGWLSTGWIKNAWAVHPEDYYHYSNLCQAEEHNHCRPPQFVSMAFDGGRSLDMWEKTTRFAAEHNIQFTYFVSGAYLLVNQSGSKHKTPSHLKWLDSVFSHKNYLAERHRGSTRPVAGKSNIAFDQSLQTVRLRFREMSKAHLQGHEIASHAIGHFASGASTRWSPGLNWSSDQWNAEFRQFSEVMMNGFDYFPQLLDGIDTDLSQWQLGFNIGSGVSGFRAPLLSSNKDMCGALVKWGFRYDTSGFHPRHRWPGRIKHCQSVWNFSLPTIAVPNRKNEILAMDYNLALSDVSVGDALQAYKNYFHKNYSGNRAPVHIGHHFAPYGGRLFGDPKYWHVMKEFAKSVCNLPEVWCTSYRNLEYFMSSAPEGELLRFNRGDFPPLYADE